MKDNGLLKQIFAKATVDKPGKMAPYMKDSLIMTRLKVKAV